MHFAGIDGDDVARARLHHAAPAQGLLRTPADDPDPEGVVRVAREAVLRVGGDCGHAEEGRVQDLETAVLHPLGGLRCSASVGYVVAAHSASFVLYGQPVLKEPA